MTAEFNFQLMMQIFFVFQRNQKRITHMLILMRRLNESIMIGDDIEIRVFIIQGGHVHLGIDAPREVSVYRKEIWECMQEEAKESSTHDE